MGILKSRRLLLWMLLLWMPILSLTKIIKVEKITFQANMMGEGVLKIHFPHDHPKVKLKIDEDDLSSTTSEGVSCVRVQLSSVLFVEDWLHRMDVSDFETPVNRISIQNIDSNKASNITFIGRANHLLKVRSEWRGNDLYLFIAKRSRYEDELKLGLMKKVSFQVKDMDLKTSLRLLAKEAGINMVINDAVSGKLTLNLKNVAWSEVLEIILTSQGLSKYQMGDVWYIAPSHLILEYEKQIFAMKAAQAASEALDIEYIRLNYANASDIMHMISEKEKTLLSKRGSVEFDRRTNTLVLEDIPQKLQKINILIQKLDIPKRQVMIEAKIVEMSKSAVHELGVNLGGSIQNIGTFSAHNGVLTSTMTNNTVNLALTRLLPGVDLNLELQAIELENQGKIVSSPHLIVSNNEKAVISQGQEVPYLQSTASGAASIAFKQALLELRVIPKIAPNHHIMLDIRVKKDQISRERVGNAMPALIDTREINTKLLTKSGETIILGGIHEVQIMKGHTKTPILGDIPLLGWLFQSKTRSMREKELLIFITPTIVQN